VYGLTVINHANKAPYNYRQQTFKDKEKNEDAKNLEFGYISTIDLLIAFTKLKSGKINFEDFKAKIKNFGLITYSNGG